MCSSLIRDIFTFNALFVFLQLFERLRKVDPNAIKKIVLLHGDILSEELGLGLKETDAIIENVSVVFHLAATLRLEAKLKDAIEMNTKGTQRVLELAKKIKNLKSFIHLSTAFCSADLEVFEEKIYPFQHNPHDVLRTIEWMKDDVLEKITPELIHPHPNTYTFSKRLSETLVANEYPNMPVTVVRPAIVTPCGMEPTPGWVDTLNGPMGLLVGGGKGVIRSMLVNGENRAQVITCDMAISAIIVIGWKMGCGKFHFDEIPVYNLTNDEAKRLTWGEVLEKGRRIVYEYPFEMQIWYPGGDIRSSKFVHILYCILFHWLPAYLIDFLMFICGQKRFMVHIMQRIDTGLSLLQFFTTREWIFRSQNFLNLVNDMSPDDQKQFPIDFFAMSEEEYMKLSILGTRLYCMKEDLSSIPRRRRVQSLLYILDRTFKIAFYLGLVWLACCCSITVKSIVVVFLSYVEKIPLIGSIVPTLN